MRAMRVHRPGEGLHLDQIEVPVAGPLALELLRKGWRVVCAGIHMTDIPALPYRDLWGLAKTGVSEDLVRISGGIEHIEDIIADVEQALTKVG